MMTSAGQQLAAIDIVDLITLVPATFISVAESLRNRLAIIYALEVM